MSVSREELADRLRSQRVEIEQALLVRTAAAPGGDPVDDVDYREGFRSAIPAAFDLSLTVIVSQDGEVPPIPPALLLHARRAARHRVGLDTVLRGYVAGSTLLDHFILDACDRGDVQTLLRLRAVALEHLLSRVSDEYESERLSHNRSREARTLEYVRGLLQGEPLETTDLDYPLTINHIGLVARGPGSREVLGKLARSLDSRALLVEVDSEKVWGWLGSSGPVHPGAAQQLISTEEIPGVSVGIGEPGTGVAGWRTTHWQADAALRIALGQSTNAARYADVCVLASAKQDSLLTASLKAIYIDPLLVGKDGGEVHLKTLRAYFLADRNGKSAASALGISRQAVAGRLRAIEERLGQPLPSCATAMEIALGLEEAG